jgi:hypothetical protein
MKTTSCYRRPHGGFACSQSRYGRLGERKISLDRTPKELICFVPIMATKKSADTKRLKMDEFVERRSPKAGDTARVLTGLLGKGAEEGTWRMYHTPDFTSFTEVKESDILRSDPIPQSLSALGGTKLTVKRNAQLRHVVNQPGHSESAAFIRGGFTSTLLRNTPPHGFSSGRQEQFKIVFTFPWDSWCVEYTCANVINKHLSNQLPCGAA